MKVHQSDILFKSLILGLIILSFFLFSTAHFPLVNSDIAVNVLIADSFTLPRDIYWWSQNRLGSFVPLISQPLIKILGISSIYAVSICNYLVITLGFIGFSKLFKNKFTILLFAIIWFFPFQRFITFNSFPIGLSYGLLGFSFLFLLKIDLSQSLFTKKNLIKIGLVGTIWLCAVWISDLILVTILTLGIAFLLHTFFNKEKKYPLKQMGAIFGGIVLFILLTIRLLKKFATLVVQDYSSFNTPSQIKEALNIVIESNFNVLTFKTDVYVSLGAWSILIFLLIGIGLIIKNFRNIIGFRDTWITFFIGDFIAMLLVIFLSHWVLLNGMGRWYFVAPYIAGTLFVLRLIDQSSILDKNIFKTVLLILTIPIGFSTVGRIYNLTGEYRSTASYVKELNELGQIGIIGDFWEAYKLAVLEPKKVMTTPHQDSDVRNPDRVLETLSQPKLYLDKDMWLDEFPDSLMQFGFLLIKKGEPFEIAQATLCEYELVMEEYSHAVFDARYLTHEGGTVNEDYSISFSKDFKHQQHSVFGPKIPLKFGQYRLEIYIDGLDIENLKDELLGDISYNFGQKVLLNFPLNKDVYNSEKECFEIEFEVPKIIANTEFRILERTSMDYVFKRFELIKLD